MSTNRLRHFIKVRCQQVVGNDVAELADPKPRQCRQHFALSFDWCGRNAIESRDAIGRDNQKPICIDFVNITNFATSEKFELRARAPSRAGYSSSVPRNRPDHSLESKDDLRRSDGVTSIRWWFRCRRDDAQSPLHSISPRLGAQLTLSAESHSTRWLLRRNQLCTSRSNLDALQKS